MAISYHIYRNDGNGGVVNYDAPIATTAGLTWTVGPLGFPSDNTFGVRAFDTVSEIEEANTDARVRIVLDSSGNDVTSQPNAILGLSATATSGGTCWVTWGYDTTGQGGSPSEFAITLTAESTTLMEPVTSTVAYEPGVSGYGVSLSGLAGNRPYLIEVQAIGTSNRIPGPAATVGLDYRVSALGNVDTLLAVALP